MSNFRIISKEEYIRRAEEKIVPKKLKTRGSDFEAIKEAGNVTISEMEVPTFESVRMSRIAEEPVLEKAEPQEEVVEEEVDYAYSVRHDEDIDYGKIEERIKGLDNVYKGENPRVEKVKPEVKEEKTSPKITKEIYEQELDRSSYSEKIFAFKGNVKKIYNQHLEEIKSKNDEILDITTKYGKETEISSKLQEGKKESQDVLNDINTWKIDNISKRKDEETISLLQHIESYFERDRKRLEKIIQEQKNNDGRKEVLGKTEKRAREELSLFEKQLQEYMEKTYPSLQDANRKDDTLKESDAAITELTGITELKKEGVVSNNVVPQSVTDIRNLKEERTNNFGGYNRFEEVRTDIPEYRGRAA